MLHKNDNKKLYKSYKIRHFNDKMLTYIAFDVIFNSAVNITFHGRRAKMKQR